MSNRGPLTSKEILQGMDNLPLPICHYSRGGTFGEGVAYAERMHGIVPCEEPEPEPEPEKGEPAAIMAVRSWGDAKECWFKPLMEDLPIGEYELYLEPKVPFVRLTEEEVNSLTYAPLEPYELICAVENRLAEKNK